MSKTNIDDIEFIMTYYMQLTHLLTMEVGIRGGNKTRESGQGARGLRLIMSNFTKWRFGPSYSTGS